MKKASATRFAAVVVACGYLAFAPSQAVPLREGAPPDRPVSKGGLSVSRAPAGLDAPIHIAFAPPFRASASTIDLKVEVHDIRGKRIHLIPAGGAGATDGLITVTWNGRVGGGRTAPPGVYVVRAVAPSIGYCSERRIVIL